MTLVMLLTLLAFQETKTVFVDRVAIKVNDKIMTERELMFTYRQAREQALAQYKGAELDKQLKEAWKETVKSAEETMLMYEKASELGYALSKDDVSAELNSMKESRGLTDEEFEKAILEQTGMSLSELIDLRQRENSAQMVFQSQVLQKIVIEDNEIAKYHEEHVADFMEPATYRIAEIVFTKNEANPAETESRVQACLADLKAGQDFGEMAKKYSDSLSKENGGDLGLVKYGDLLDSIEAKVKSMKVGDYSEKLETATAIFLIKLLEQNPSKPKPVDMVRDQVVSALRQPRTEAQLVKFIEQLRAEFSVKTFITEIPWYLEY